jgi:hypothetical protein
VKKVLTGTSVRLRLNLKVFLDHRLLPGNLVTSSRMRTAR